MFIRTYLSRFVIGIIVSPMQNYNPVPPYRVCVCVPARCVGAHRHRFIKCKWILPHLFVPSQCTTPRIWCASKINWDALHVILRARDADAVFCVGQSYQFYVFDATKGTWNWHRVIRTQQNIRFVLFAMRMRWQLRDKKLNADEHWMTASQYMRSPAQFSLFISEFLLFGDFIRKFWSNTVYSITKCDAFSVWSPNEQIESSCVPMDPS